MQKPVLSSYVFRYTLRLSWLYVSIFVLGMFIGLSVLTSFLSSLLFAFGYSIRAWRIWRREEFHREDNRLRWERGTLFSRSSTEISFSSVTVVTKSSSYLQRMFFDTCTVTLDSAGTQSSSIVLRDIPRSLEGYEYVRELLETDAVMFETEPEVRGVVMNGVESLVNLALTLFLLGTSVIVVYSEAVQVLLDELQQAPVLFFFIALLVSFLVLRSILPTIDLLMRKYVVTDSFTVLEGGFFTHVKQVLRKDAVTDSAESQTFLERLVDVRTVTVSCRGTASNILYRYVRDPEPLLKTLEKERKLGVSEEEKEFTDSERRVEEGEERKEYSFEPFKIRVLVPVTIVVLIGVLFPFALLFIFPFLFALIKPLRTTYVLSDSEVSETYSLFSTSKRVFSEEEITGVRKRVTLIDDLFGTYSVDVWSVGADSPITLQYMQDDSVWERLTSTYTVGEVEKRVGGDKSVSAIIQSFLPLFFGYGVVLGFFGVTLVIGLLGVVLALWVLYEFYVSDKRELVFTEGFVLFTQGGPIRVESIVPRDAVQSGYFTKYLVSHGSIELHLPGYTAFSVNTALFSLFHPASIPYVRSEDVDVELLELYGESLTKSKVSLVSEGLRNLIPAGILFGLAVFFDLGLLVSTLVFFGYLVLNLVLSRVIDIDVRTTGVSVTKGVLFRQRLFIPFEKVDHVDEQRSWYELLTRAYTLAVWTMNNEGGNIVVPSVKKSEIISVIKERLYKKDD